MQMKVKGQIYFVLYLRNDMSDWSKILCAYAAWLANQNTRHQVDNIDSKFHVQTLNLRPWIADGVSPNLSQWQVQI